jgi:hypothetical protein
MIKSCLFEAANVWEVVLGHSAVSYTETVAATHGTGELSWQPGTSESFASTHRGHPPRVHSRWRRVENKDRDRGEEPPHTGNIQGKGSFGAGLDGCATQAG